MNEPSEPEIALVASPREWAQRLHQYVADHGGARVRATVLDPHDAIMEHYDVLVLDDTTSFLSTRLVHELHRRGRLILGVHDDGDHRGEAELRDVGVDGVIERGATEERFLDAIRALVPLRAQVSEEPAEAAEPTPPPEPLAPIVAVCGPPGGTGVTEVALALAAEIARRGEPVALVDGDASAPALIPRLALRPYPNLLAAVEAAEREDGDVVASLHPLIGGSLRILPGTVRPGAWGDLRAAQLHALLDALARDHRHVLVDAGVQPWPPQDEPRAPAAVRVLIERADVIIGVASPSPVGMLRLVSWYAAVRTANHTAPIHVILNRTPSDRFRRAESHAELTRALDPTSIRFFPYDSRVDAASWAGALVGQGPFWRAVQQFAKQVLPARHGAGRGGAARSRA